MFIFSRRLFSYSSACDVDRKDGTEKRKKRGRPSRLEAAKRLNENLEESQSRNTSTSKVSSKEQHSTRSTAPPKQASDGNDILSSTKSITNMNQTNNNSLNIVMRVIENSDCKILSEVDLAVLEDYRDVVNDKLPNAEAISELQTILAALKEKLESATNR